jgi:hypothetical protein
VKSLTEKPLFTEHIRPVLSQYGKLKQKLLLRLISSGFHASIRWW